MSVFLLLGFRPWTPFRAHCESCHPLLELPGLNKRVYLLDIQ